MDRSKVSKYGGVAVNVIWALLIGMALGLLLVVLLAQSGCTTAKELQPELVLLRKHFHEFKAFSAPRPDVDPATWEQVAENLDGTVANLIELAD